MIETFRSKPNAPAAPSLALVLPLTTRHTRTAAPSEAPATAPYNPPHTHRSSKRSPSKFVAAFSNSANPNSKPHNLFEDDMDAWIIEPAPSLNAIPGWKRSLHR